MSAGYARRVTRKTVLATPPRPSDSRIFVQWREVGLRSVRRSRRAAAESSEVRVVPATRIVS